MDAIIRVLCKTADKLRPEPYFGKIVRHIVEVGVEQGRIPATMLDQEILDSLVTLMRSQVGQWILTSISRMTNATGQPPAPSK